MGVNNRNLEGYPDPVPKEALDNISREGRRAAKQSFRPLVYICSPYSGDIQRNMEAARRFCRFAVDSGYIPIAPHLQFPQFMDDDNPAERDMALFMDFVLIGKCHEVWVFGDKVSKGMAAEITYAKKRSRTIRYFSSEQEEVQTDA